MSPATSRRPLFWQPGTGLPVGTLAVDGQVPGAAGTYSHWRTAPEPPTALAADTSTAICLAAAADADRWLAPFAAVAIDHLDADGLLAVITACRPAAALPHGPLLTAAAEAADFTCWTGEAAYRLVLRLHQHLREHRASGRGWEQRALDDGVDRLEPLLAESQAGSRVDGGAPGDVLAEERDLAVAQARMAIDDLASGRIPVLDRGGGLSVVTWERHRGRGRDDHLAVFEPQDLPPIALSTAIPGNHFQLLIEEVGGGRTVTLDAPRHSWARTVDRPTIPWPDLSALARRLQAIETGTCRWVARPDAAAAGFVTQLATLDQRGALGRSRLDQEVLVAVIGEGLVQGIEKTPAR